MFLLVTPKQLIIAIIVVWVVFAIVALVNKLF